MQLVSEKKEKWCYPWSIINTAFNNWTEQEIWAQEPRYMQLLNVLLPIKALYDRWIYPRPSDACLPAVHLQQYFYSPKH